MNILRRMYGTSVDGEDVDVLRRPTMFVQFPRIDHETLFCLLVFAEDSSVMLRLILIKFKEGC